MSKFRFVHERVSPPEPPDPDKPSQQPIHPVVLPHKQRKTRFACTACRTAKIRCDGRRPRCSRCVSRGGKHNCVYEKEALKTKRYVTLLESRVVELESQIPALSPNRGSISSSNSAAQESTRDDHSLLGSAATPLPKSPRVDVPNERKHSSNSHENLLDKTDALIMVPSPEGAPSNHGGSSITTFLQSIAQTVGMAELADQTLPQTGGNHCFLSEDKNLRKQTPSLLSLPNRRTADALMSTFWTYIHSIFPVLHRPTTESMYESLWVSGPDTPNQNSTEERPVEKAILNIIFALGCQSSDREDAADDFYRKSREYYSMDELDVPSLETVQLLLLTGIYLQSTKYASRCWNMVGSAIRNAQYLGLDVEHPGKAIGSQLEQEMRRRVWYSCVIIDRLSSLSFNQRSTISSQCNVQLPAMIDDEYLSSGGSQTLNHESKHTLLAFFIYSIELFEILNSALVNVYHNPPTGRPPCLENAHWWPRKQLGQITSLNSELDDLTAKLPAHLRPIDSRDEDGHASEDPLRWQGYIFRCRFLYIRVLVLRPLLLSAATAQIKLGRFDNDPNAFRSLEEDNARKCCSLCIQSVHQLVENMSARLENGSHFARWREIHYAFLCAIAIFIARLCPFEGDGLEESTLNLSWLRCMSILDHFKPRIPSVKRAVEMLRCLDLHISWIIQGNTHESSPLSPQKEAHGGENSLFSSSLTGLFDDHDPLSGFDPRLIDEAWLGSQIGGFGWLV